MKFVSLRRERTDRQGKLEKPSSAMPESFTNPIAVPRQIHTYSELRQKIHDDLRIQHPEWIQPNGQSPMCDAYEARLTELLDTLKRRASDQLAVGKNHMNPLIQLKG